MSDATPHPSYDLLIGSPEQTALLAAMAAGQSIVVTGAGGTGKTTVARRYMAWLARESVATVVHHFALQTPDDQGVVAGYSSDRLVEAVQDCAIATQLGRRVVAIVDEYTLLEPEDYALLGCYDQVIATGDPAQDRAAGATSSTAFVDFMRARGAMVRNADRVWRSAHLPANGLLDYYAYGGLVTAVPLNGGPLPDILRANCVPDGPEAAAVAIFARLVRAARMNPRFKTTVAVRDADTRDVLEKLMAVSGLVPGNGLNCAFVDPAYMQGLETDILLVVCRDFDRIFRTPDSIARAATTTLGRARNKTELLFVEEDAATSAGRMTYTLLMKMMLAYAPEPRISHPGLLAVEPEFNERGVDLIPIDQGVMLYDRGKNVGFKVLLGTDPRTVDEAVKVVLDVAHLEQMAWREVRAVPADLMGNVQVEVPSVHNVAERTRDDGRALARKL